jgi:hypothetical protein
MLSMEISTKWMVPDHIVQPAGLKIMLKQRHTLIFAYREYLKGKTKSVTVLLIRGTYS